MSSNNNKSNIIATPITTTTAAAAASTAFLSSAVLPTLSNDNNKDTSTSRKRTRATPEQLEILEKTFTINPSPNNRIREQLSHELGMSERSIQIWFQNRRAKVKNEAKKNTLLHDETLKMQYYASTAAIAACQAAVFYQQERNNELKIVEDPIKSNPNLYYYYYYYYFNQQQSRRYNRHPYHCPMQQYSKPSTLPSSSHTLKSMSFTPPLPPPPPPPPLSLLSSESIENSSHSDATSPHSLTQFDSHSLWSKKQLQQQRARAHTMGPSFTSNNNYYYQQPFLPYYSKLDRSTSVELSISNNNNNNNTTPVATLSPDASSSRSSRSSSSSSSTSTSSNPVPIQENYTNMLNDISHAATSSASSTLEESITTTIKMESHQPTINNFSTTDPSGLQQQQNQFINNLNNNTHVNISLPYQSTSPSFFDQQDVQLTWSDVPFYDNSTMMMMTTTTTVAATPTTSSFVVDTLPTTYELQQQSTYNSTQHPFIQSISAETLQIGTWKRVTLNPHDLQCQYDKGNKLFSWCIQDGLSKFKMEFPESSLKSIQLMPLQTRAGWARLEMFILSAEHISFYMKSLHQHGWVQCRDYTEDKQASTVLLHQLDGPALALKAELDILLKENPYLASILFK